MKFINKKALIALLALGSISIANANQYPVKITAYQRVEIPNIVTQNIEVTSLEDNILIYSITVNRGRCAKREYNQPRKLNYAQTIKITKGIGLINKRTGQKLLMDLV